MQAELNRLKRVDAVQDAWLEYVKALGESRIGMNQIGKHHINQLLAMQRQYAAEGMGFDPATIQQLAQPYPGSNVTVYAPQTTQTPTAQAAKSAFLPWLAGIGLAATGLGGAAGAYYAVSNPPAAKVQPADFQVKVGFDPDKGGLQVGPLEPSK